uniref:Complement C3d receptor 2 n=1 Tax=Propithecus coquereli TaxID=379532 RepID=A0A2K6GAU3_PROCO
NPFCKEGNHLPTASCYPPWDTHRELLRRRFIWHHSHLHM